MDDDLDLRTLIRTIPDHPKPGILFRDITTLLEDPAGLRVATDRLVGHLGGGPADGSDGAGVTVAGIESRGFVFGAALAYAAGSGLVMVRKAGKLPGRTVGREYDLEYGTDRIEIHLDAVEVGQRVVVVDDLLATGGTAVAAVELLRSRGAVVDRALFVVDLPDLGGASALREVGCEPISLVAYEGH